MTTRENQAPIAGKDAGDLARWRRDAERMDDIEWEGNYHGRRIALDLLNEIDRLRASATASVRVEWESAVLAEVVEAGCTWADPVDHVNAVASALLRARTRVTAPDRSSEL